MTCGDAQSLLERFFDGELPGDEMRDVARHLARCGSCEALTTEFENAQQLLRQAVHMAVGQPDIETAWRSIAPRLEKPRRSVRERVVGFIEQVLPGGLPMPVMVGAATAAVLAVVFWAASGRGPGDAPEPQQIAAARTRIDSLDSPGSVSVWNQPDNGALVIWVDSDGLNVENLAP